MHMNRGAFDEGIGFVGERGSMRHPMIQVISNHLLEIYNQPISCLERTQVLALVAEAPLCGSRPSGCARGVR